jgi:hypothetical protein
MITNRRSFVALACTLLAIAAASPAVNVQGEITPINPSDFDNPQIITFETGSTELPHIPGVTFLDTPPSDTMPWYGGSCNFDGFFGMQGWSNLVSSTYSELGLQLATPVQAVGGYVGWIPNFTMQNPATVLVELFDASHVSLGTAQITLTPAYNSPVFFGFTASEPIAGFRMTGNNTGFFSVDNFTYGALVPEPDTFALAGIGIMLLVSRQTNKCRKRPDCIQTRVDGASR